MPSQAQVFYSTYEKFRWDFNARWCDIHDAMKREAWKHIDMEYDRLHSDLLEVCWTTWEVIQCSLHDARGLLPTGYPRRT